MQAIHLGTILSHASIDAAMKYCASQHIIAGAIARLPNRRNPITSIYLNPKPYNAQLARCLLKGLSLQETTEIIQLIKDPTTLFNLSHFPKGVSLNFPLQASFTPCFASTFITFQYPPLSGPIRRMCPDALSFSSTLRTPATDKPIASAIWSKDIF